MSAALQPHKIAALRFLAQGPDTIGVIDTEEKMVAALVFFDLMRRGLVQQEGRGADAKFSLTQAGIEAVLEAGL